jgi:hypothetical protein
MKTQLTEARAAEAILGERLRVNIPAPLALRLLGKKTIPLWFRPPVAAQLLRISAAFVRMGLDPSALDKGEALTLFTEIARHLVPCSRIIALGLLRGRLASALFARPLARYLRAHMDMESLAKLTKLIVYLSGAENFASIIRSVSYMKLTTPVLSHEKTGS